MYDGIDLPDFSQNRPGMFRKEYDLGRSPVIGLVGRIVIGKGHEEFILASKEILKVRPDVKIVIVGDAKGGDGDYYEKIKKMIKKEKLEQKIIFTGWINDIGKVIADLDILIQATTTYPEGFGLTIVEAMALGKPVVATMVPGPSEIVVNNETGYLVRPEDVNAMANAILKLLNDPTLAAQMGKAGRRRVEELFDIRKNMKEVQSIYAEYADACI